MRDVDMTTKAADNSPCEVCGANKQPNVVGFLSEDVVCERCYAEVAAEAQKRIKLHTKDVDENSADSKAFAAFLERTAAVLFQATPGLKPKILVDKVWRCKLNSVDPWLERCLV